MGITAKQKEIFDYIDKYINKNGYSPTQREIKEHFNFKSFGSVQRYINYLVESGHLQANWNERRGLKPTTSISEKHFNQQPNFEEIPLLGKIAAGSPIEAVENQDSADNLISVPSHFIKRGHNYFALKVEGLSMIEDGILDGDIIVCKKGHHAERGDTVVALVDGEATVKNFYPHQDFVELRPANALMKPIKVTSETFKIAGILVGLIRSYV